MVSTACGNTRHGVATFEFMEWFKIQKTEYLKNGT